MLPDSVREPLLRAAVIIAIVVGAAVLLIGPFLDLLAAFGLALTPEQRDAITSFLQAVVAALGSLGVAQAVRPQVTPVEAPVLKPGQQVTVSSGEGADDAFTAWLPREPGG